MDSETSPRKIGAALRDLARVNRFLFGLRASVRSVAPYLARGARSLLDVAAGGGDVAAAIASEARRLGRPLRVAVLDRNPAMLSVARRADESFFPVAGDAGSLPFGDRAFDVVHGSLFLHHLEPGGAPPVLRELFRVARLALVLNDLRRHRVAHAAIVALSRIAFRSELVRIDGPLSVLRAYTPDEARDLVFRAGLPEPRIARTLGFRMTIVVERPGAL